MMANQNIGIHHTLVALLGLVASGWISPAFAEEAEPSPAPASVPLSYGGDLATRSTLTGDWGGSRDLLFSNGIVIRPELTSFYQGPFAGSEDEAFDLGTKFGLFVDIDASAWAWEGFGIHLKGEYNSGSTVGAIGGTTLPNNAALSFPDINAGDFTSFYVSQRTGDFSLLLGQIDIIDLYSMGPLYNGGRGIDSFQHMTMVAPPSGTVPVGLLGAIASYSMQPYKFSFWIYDQDDKLNKSALEDPFSQGVSLRASIDIASTLGGLARTDSFTVYGSNYPGVDFTTIPEIGQFSGTPEFRAALIKALISDALFGQNGGSELPPELLASAAPSEIEGRYYLSYAFQQELWTDPHDPSSTYGLFGQAAISDGNPNPVQWSALFGIGGSGLFPGRAQDRFGIGTFYYAYSSDLKSALNPIIDLRDEYGMEAFYNWQVREWCWISADLQLIQPAVKAELENGAMAQNDMVGIFGLRLDVKF